MELGCGQAMENLGAIYEQNYSSRSDRGNHAANLNQAINLYEAAVNEGVETANTHLAILYEKMSSEPIYQEKS